ncbi:restriction modification system DNA specificity domain-containing protein [Pseudodesulfovibrio mercurii]|uniref:Restriction modification system DNA specificity domain-containing protein n=1 Tax=Pseudodesulfovibrio mercurii TaxID=641491 RepID=F0JE97_9BACT|nr:restriction endonuclease subunit S [Pseudodesulfovibrio mercurii]EGB14706.1 restriction modification system DNA specificity domain-containing protein [Pseudodesulfovibrio mercurii]
MTWGFRTLDALLDKSGTDRAGKQDLPILSITMSDGLVDQSEKFKKRVASRDTTKYRIAHRNELVVGFPIDEGVLGFQTKYPAGIVSPAYDIWKLKSPNDTFIPYLERYLRSNQARQIYASKMKGAVARRRSLSKVDFLGLEIPFPSFDDQKRIAHLLGKVEGLIARRKQHLQQLDDLLKSVFLKMFGDPVRNEMGWETELLGELATIERGRFSPRPRNDPKFYNGAYPFIQTGDISRSNGRLREYTQTLNELGIKVSKKFDVGTIVIAIVGATIGETAILQIPTYAPDSVIGITPKSATKETESVFIEFLLRFWKPVLRARAPEAARANINIETLRPLPVICPLDKDRERFATIVEKVEDLKSRYQQSLADMEYLYGALSQKAFNGELDLSRIVLPDEQQDAMAEEYQPQEIQEDNTAIRSLELSTPDIEALLELATPDGRKPTIEQWLKECIGQMRVGETFSAQLFLEKVLNKMIELDHDGLFEDWGRDGEPKITIADYDSLKDMIFKLIENGTLIQAFATGINSLQVAPA